MKLNPHIFDEGLSKVALINGGRIVPMYFDLPLEDGVAIMNPSIINIEDRLIVTMRCVNYTLWHSQNLQEPHTWGPLQYMHPQDHCVLGTVNYVGTLDPKSLQLDYCSKVDMRLDVKPIWEFIGLEDPRLAYWNDKMYLIGVRRDTTPNGEGRMELSEIQIKDGSIIEVDRQRIPTPNNEESYCEKNWMPIIDRPYEFIKWSNPVEIAIYDPNTKTTSRRVTNSISGSNWVRGGTQVIPWKDKYVCIGHSVELWKPSWGVKDSTYHQHLIIFDKDLNVEYISDGFTFNNARIEFECGMCIQNDNFLITFAESDNAAYVVEIPQNVLIID